MCAISAVAELVCYTDNSRTLVCAVSICNQCAAHLLMLVCSGTRCTRFWLVLESTNLALLLSVETRQEKVKYVFLISHMEIRK